MRSTACLRKTANPWVCRRLQRALRRVRGGGSGAPSASRSSSIECRLAAKYHTSGTTPELTKGGTAVQKDQLAPDVPLPAGLRGPCAPRGRMGACRRERAAREACNIVDAAATCVLRPRQAGRARDCRPSRYVSAAAVNAPLPDPDRRLFQLAQMYMEVAWAVEFVGEPGGSPDRCRGTAGTSTKSADPSGKRRQPSHTRTNNAKRNP